MNHIGTRVALLVLLVVTASCRLSPSSSNPRSSEVDTVTAFLSAVASGDDVLAATYLSSTAVAAVSSYCPNGSVVACFDGYGRQQWGDLREVFWQYGITDGISAYTTVWDNDVILIVVELVNRNRLWEITGWRGVVSDKSEGWTDELLTGTDAPNQFPPPDKP